MGGFAALRDEPNLAVADGLVKTKPTADQALWPRMPLGEFENTNPMGGFAALRNEPNLAAADCLAKTKPTADQALWPRMPLGEFENSVPSRSPLRNATPRNGEAPSPKRRDHVSGGRANIKFSTSLARWAIPADENG